MEQVTNNSNIINDPVPQKPKKLLPVILIVIALLIIAGGAAAWMNKEKLGFGQKACTLEAKLCPDGSSVGRVGPNCEFAACPNIPIVGNDKDEHGCIGSAGYSWCQEKQKCLRVWEETCAASDSVVEKKLLGLNKTWLAVSPIFEPVNGKWNYIRSYEEFKNKGYIDEQINWVSLIGIGRLDGNSFIAKNQFPKYFIKNTSGADNWVEYKNFQYGFKFKYPNNMQCDTVESSVRCKGNSVSNITVLPNILINIVKGVPSAQLSTIDSVEDFRFDGQALPIVSLKTVMHSDMPEKKRWRAQFVEFALGQTDYFIEINYPTYPILDETSNIKEQDQFFDNFFSNFSSLCEGAFSNRAECLK